MKHLQVKNTVETACDQSAWFRHWFDSAFYHQLYGHRDEKEAAAFIDALLEKLDPASDSKMLDLGCGTGRHAKYLASKGFNVTGFDLAASSIRNAKRFETGNLYFARHDMREPFSNDRFDYIFNFFTSFGYFNTEEENHKVIRNIYHALKPGGTLVLDYINVFYSEQQLIAEERREIDGIVYRISRWTDLHRFFKKINVENGSDDQRPEYVEQVAKFYLHDFELMFIRNGLQLQAVYGNYDLHEYETMKSPRLILMAKKPDNLYRP